MALTVASLMDHVRHELGGPPPVGLGVWLINQAGRHVFAMHPWRSAIRQTATVNYTAGNNYASLPDDFGELIAVYQSSAASVLIDILPLEELEYMRQAGVGATHEVVAVATYQNGGETRFRLELLDTPAADQTAALTIVYAARWVDVDDDDEVTCPPWLEGLLVQSVRKHARGFEMGDLDQQLAILRQSEVFRVAVLQDTPSRNLGRMAGGGAMPGGRVGWYDYIKDTQVSDPP